MDKLVFVPLTEQYNVDDKERIYRTEFKLGFFYINLHLVTEDVLGVSKEKYAQLKKENPEFIKRYLCVMAIGQYGWVWFASNNLIEAELIYKDAIKRLKYGDSYEFKDIAKQQRPLKISWRDIVFEW